VNRLAALAAAVVLALAACGGTEATTEKAGTAPASTSIFTVTVEGPATTSTIIGSSARPAAHFRSFRMPSKNVGCALFGGILRCDVLSGLQPEPKRKCDLDWTGITIGRTGPAQAQCAGDTVYDQHAPVLAYGRTWSRRGIHCASQTTGIRCRNEDERGFTLARASWRTF
jgi:hypothetical protein